MIYKMKLLKTGVKNLFFLLFPVIGGCLHSCSGTGLCRQGRYSYFHDIGYDK